MHSYNIKNFINPLNRIRISEPFQAGTVIKKGFFRSFSAFRTNFHILRIPNETPV